MKKVYEFIATGLYVGYLPIAPGTLGSLTAVIIVWCLSLLFDINIYIKCTILILTIIIGLLSASAIMKDTKDKDPQYIVIDEWAGQLTTLMLVPVNLENIIVGFVLFRIFDILKIFPIKNAEKLRGAWGVMTDDILAGIYAAPLLFLWDKFI